MQAYVLLALAGFLLTLVAAVGIGTLLRRARPANALPFTPLDTPLEPIAPDAPPAVLPFDDSPLADETHPVRPIAAIPFSPLPNPVDTMPVLAADDDTAPNPDQLSLLIEPDDELTPQQRSVRRLIAYFQEKTSAPQTAATR